MRKLAIALPIVFALHVIEEAPGFVDWFNALVTPPITQQAFNSVNAAGFAITLIVSVVLAASRDPAAALVGVAWVGFLMLANGLFHVVATVARGHYCPGVVTGVLLYLPLSVLFVRMAIKERGVAPLTAAVVALAGGIPMYVHGYLIVFRGSRLF